MFYVSLATSTANPLSCAAAAAVLEYIVKENVVQNAQDKGHYLGRRLKEALDGNPIVGDIRVSRHAHSLAAHRFARC